MSAATERDMNETDGNGSGEGPRRSSLVQERSRRTERMPRAAIARTLREFYKHPARSREHSATRQVFPVLIEAAQKRGELPADSDPRDIADMLNALMITAVEGWVHGAYPKLAPELAYRVRVLLAGVRSEHAP